jgi:hypothetical protein
VVAEREHADEERTAALRSRKVARRAGWASVQGPGAEEAATEPAGAPRGQRRDEGAWEAQLARLVAYKEAHGDCSVPQGWAEDRPLGTWVGTQRQGKKKLDRGDPSPGMTAARAAKLEALGFAWAMSSEQISKRLQAAKPKHEAKQAVAGPAGAPRGGWDEGAWEAQLARLAVYKAAHGDCNVPRSWAEDAPLGGWVHNQRKCKKALDRGDPSPGMTAARAARLEALGFGWAMSSEQLSKKNQAAATNKVAWEEKLARLAAYKEVYGDCNVPQGWAEDPRLGSWVNMQRGCKKALDRGEASRGMTAARAARLEALGFVWAPGLKPVGASLPNEVGWEAKLVRLAAYKEAHGDCNVPQGWAEDRPLGKWVQRQRQGKRKLDRSDPRPGMTVARAARLEALGLAWAPPRGARR